ncbi:MAG TPA: hypothetical protein VF363_01735 [Candidatus Eisenbacteria bacterium]
MSGGPGRVAARRTIAWLGAAALAAGLAGARAGTASPLETIAGWEGDEFHQGYAFATAGTFLGEGGTFSIPVQATGSYLYYDYEDRGASVAVRAPGAGAATGIRATRSSAIWTLLAGGEVRWERRDRPGGAGADAVVAKAGAVVQGTADLKFARRVRPFLLASYSGSARYLYGRAALRLQCSNLDWTGSTVWLVGLEGVAQGNRDTDAVQAGALLECALTRARASLGIHGGYKDGASPTGGRRRGGYAGLSLYRRF